MRKTPLRKMARSFHAVIRPVRNSSKYGITHPTSSVWYDLDSVGTTRENRATFIKAMEQNMHDRQLLCRRKRIK